MEVISNVDDRLCLGHGLQDDFRQLHQGLVVTLHLQVVLLELIHPSEYKLCIDVIRLLPQMLDKRSPIVMTTHHLQQHVGVYLDVRVAKLADAGLVALDNVGEVLDAEHHIQWITETTHSLPDDSVTREYLGLLEGNFEILQARLVHQLENGHHVRGDRFKLIPCIMGMLHGSMRCLYAISQAFSNHAQARLILVAAR